MKKLSAAMILSGLMALLLLAGCGSGDQPATATTANPADYAGTYLGVKSLGSFIELKPDGTFRLKDADLDLTGTFEVSGDTLTLTAYAEFSKPPVQGKIDGGKIVDPSGANWFKRGQGPTETQPLPAVNTQTQP